MFELDEKIYLDLLLIIPIIFGLYLYLLYWKSKKQKEFGQLELVKRLSAYQSKSKQFYKFLGGMWAIIFIVVALVNPKVGTKLETVKREGIDIVFAVDVSKSMLAEDIAPNRLEKSKQLVMQLINQLGADRIGIVAYAGSAYPVLPITTDYSVAKMFLQSMNTDMVSSQGTAINEAIELAAQYFNQEEQTARLLVLISDGEDHSQDAKDAAENAAENGMKIITIGVGTSKGGPIPIKSNGIVKSFLKDSDGEVVVTKMNEEELKNIALATSGVYINGSSTKQVVDEFKKELDEIEKKEYETQKVSDYKDQFQWFLALAFLVLFLDIFVLERKTPWIKRLNLFNEKES